MSAQTATPGIPPAARGAAPVGQAAVVYNPIKVDIDAIRESVAKHEKAAGWPETLFFETSADDPGRGPTKEAIKTWLEPGALTVRGPVGE